MKDGRIEKFDTAIYIRRLDRTRLENRGFNSSIPDDCSQAYIGVRRMRAGRVLVTI